MTNINKEIYPLTLKNQYIYKDIGAVAHASTKLAISAFPIEYMSYEHDNFAFNVNAYNKIGINETGTNEIKEYFTADDVFKWFLFNGMSFTNNIRDLNDNQLNEIHKFDDIPREKIGHNPTNALLYINSASECSRVDEIKKKILKNIHLLGELENKTFDQYIFNILNPKK